MHVIAVFLEGNTEDDLYKIPAAAEALAPAQSAPLRTSLLYYFQCNRNAGCFVVDTVYVPTHSRPGSTVCDWCLGRFLIRNVRLSSRTLEAVAGDHNSRSILRFGAGMACDNLQSLPSYARAIRGQGAIV